MCLCGCGGCDSPKSLELVVKSKFLPSYNLSYGEEANTKPPIHCPLETQKHTHSEHGAAKGQRLPSASRSLGHSCD